MTNIKIAAAFVGACVLSFMAGRVQFGATPVQAQERAFTALDYQEITQLINRYATCVTSRGTTRCCRRPISIDRV